MPSPRLMPIPTTDTTASATTVLDTDSVPTPTATTDTTARGLLTPSPPLLLRPSPRLILLRILRPWLPRLRIRTPRLRIRIPLRLRHYGYYGKRSADAEPAAAPESEAAADSYYGYYGLGYHGLGYRAYGGYYGHGLGYYGYGHGLYGYYGVSSNSSQPKTSLEIASRTSEKWIATFGLIP